MAAAIAHDLGEQPGACTVERFPDGEVAVKLLALADACRRGAAARITAVVPYFGYGRSDKRQGRSEPIMGRVVAV